MSNKFIKNVNKKQLRPEGLTRRNLLKFGLYGGMAASLSAGLWINGCGKLSEQKKPNVIFLLIDALRADYLGCYGHTGGHSPGLDAIAADSVQQRAPGEVDAHLARRTHVPDDPGAKVDIGRLILPVEQISAPERYTALQVLLDDN